MDQASFDGQALWQTVKAVENRLDEDDLAPHRQMLMPVRFVAARTLALRELDPQVATQSMVTVIQQHWQNVEASLAQFRDTSNTAYLQQALDHADNCTAALGSWPDPPAKGGAAAKANRTFTDYRASTERLIDHLDQQVADAKLNLGTQQSAYEAAITDLESKISTLQGQVEAESQRITADEGRLDAAITTNETNFNSAQATRATEYDTWIEKQESEFDEKLKPHLDAVEHSRNAAAETLEGMSQLQEQVAAVAGSTTGLVLTGGYATYARREWWSGVVGYVFGIGLLIGVGTVLYFTLRGVQPDESLSWGYVTLKLGLSAAAVAAATVAIKFGSKSIERSSKNKRIELELQSIIPFLADIDAPDEAKAIKVQFVSRMFGRAWDEPETRNDDSTVNLALLKDLAGLLNRSS